MSVKPRPDKPSSTFVVIAICATQVLTMMGLFTFPALLPEFSEIWNLSNTGAGWISGIVLGAYALSVPVLVALTDRIDARLIHLGGTFTTAISLAGFAAFAEGFWSALALRALAGVALAATYMPGLRMLVDRYQGQRQARMVAFYTASFSLGSALSFYLAGVIGAALGWQWAFGAAALGAAGAFLVILTLIRPSPPEAAADTALLDFRPILRNREVLGYIIAYGAHSWELFAMRAWLVAFLAFSLSLAPAGRGLWPSPTEVAAIGAIIAVFGSIFGNEAAGRYGRRRVVSGYLLVSAIMASFLGFLAGAPYWILVLLTLLYAALIQLDSAALTAGAIEEAEPGRRGATLGVHSFVGFMGAAAGPLAVGIVLDISGGAGIVGGGDTGAGAFTWGLGFIAMGIVGFIGPVALALLRGKKPA